MLTFALTYLTLALGGVAVLSLMILRIGRLMGDCPQNGPASRVASITAATGFAAIGVGGVILIGAGFSLVAPEPVAGLLLPLGMASLCLGLGFTQAIATLQTVLQPPAEAA